MLIKFTGSGWDASVVDRVFLVTRTITNYALREYIDANGNRVYASGVKHTVETDGVYFNKILYNA